MAMVLEGQEHRVGIYSTSAKGLMLLSRLDGVGGEGQMDVCRGEKTGRVDSIYNCARSVTNAVKRDETS